jgi:Flp pilus assembly protein TadG
MARVIGRGAFGRDASGTSVLEFALCAPLFIVLLLVGVDTVRYMSATRQVEDVATTIGQMISVEQDGAISSKDLQFYHDAAMVIFPQVLADAAQQSKTWDKDIGISVASIQFTASSPTCKVKCTYVAKVLWAGGTTPRSCSVRPTAVADTAGPSSTTLPTSVYGAGSIIVVDVSFSFRPTIAPRFMPTLPIRRSYYVAPRYTPTITYADAAGGTGFAHAC